MLKKSFSSRPKQSSQQPLPNKQDATSDDVEKGITSLKRCREIGLKLKELDLSRLGKPELKELAKSMGVPPEETRRYVQFARKFNEQELEDLYAAFRAANFVFKFSHFRVLIAVKDKPSRKELALKGVQERLGTESLRRLMEETIGNPRAQGGRRPKILKLNDDELERAVSREKKRFAGQLRQVLSLPREIKPALRTELQQLLEHLQ